MKNLNSVKWRKNGYYKVVIDETDYLVKYSQTDEPEIINGNSTSEVQLDNEPVSDETGMVVSAPLAGNIFRIEKNVGDTVSDDETIIVLEQWRWNNNQNTN